MNWYRQTGIRPQKSPTHSSTLSITYPALALATETRAKTHKRTQGQPGGIFIVAEFLDVFDSFAYF
jgi:hypothetical protein